MGKKRKSKPMRPWCWYCEKDFEDDKVLVTHQRAKHFKCEECNKKLTTAGGMVVHSHQVHKIDIYRVPNALPGRDKLDIEIFGMEGIPEADMIAHEARLAGANNSNKKGKSGGSGQYGELTMEQIQQQMAAHKAGSAAAGYPPPVAESSPVIAAPPVIQQTPQPPQQNYYDAYNPYGGYQQPFGNQYYPAQNYGYPGPTPNTGMVPPAPYPNQWGYQPPYSNNNSMPRPPMPAPPQQPLQQQPLQQQPLEQEQQEQQRLQQQQDQQKQQHEQQKLQPSTSIPVAPEATANAPNPPSNTPLPSATEVSLNEHNSPPLSSIQQTPAQQKPVPYLFDKRPSTVPTNGKKKASKIVLIYNNNEISPEEQRAQLEKHRVY